MKHWAQSLSVRRKRLIFGTLVTIITIVSLFPPIYWACGSASANKSFPLSLVYFLVVGALIVAAVEFFYMVEKARNELD